MAEQVELKSNDCLHPEIAPTSGDRVPTVKCVYCGDFMVRDRLPSYNRTYGIGLLILGLVLTLFFPAIGLPTALIGVYMGLAAKHVWVCRLCAAMVDRDGD